MNEGPQTVTPIQQRGSCLDESRIARFVTVAKLATPGASTRIIDTWFSEILNHTQGCTECARAIEDRMNSSQDQLSDDREEQRDTEIELLTTSLRQEMAYRLARRDLNATDASSESKAVKGYRTRSKY